VTSKKGAHSAELERLSTARTKVKSLVLTVRAKSTAQEGEGIDVPSLAIEITNGRITYAGDGNEESWQVSDFDGVHRTKTTHRF
jgi:hypothetical protein